MPNATLERPAKSSRMDLRMEDERKAAYEEAGISGQMSFEERMGCGFGACMGCSIETKNGPKRICKDGPVLRTEEILW